ncbi:MAG: DNA primase [Burkholderiales bacterium]|nr:DNA primase [Burkholderiales bacterium]
MATKRPAARQSSPTSVPDAAQSYLARGWSVVPAEARGKRPVLPWLEFQQRRADAGEARHWFEARKQANVAVVTGVVSGLVVLDIDVAHGGQDSLEQLEGEHGALPATIEAITGGGGRHLYFRHPGAVVRNRVGLMPGIDVRGDGGCVVAPPSVHRSGQRYQWKRGRAPGQADLAAMPTWLLDLVRGEQTRSGHSIAHWRKLVGQGVDQGRRNSTIASLAGHLFHRGVDAQVTLELLLAWNRARCHPPLSDHEVARAVESISRLHERGQSKDDIGDS